MLSTAGKPSTRGKCTRQRRDGSDTPDDGDDGRTDGRRATGGQEGETAWPTAFGTVTVDTVRGRRSEKPSPRGNSDRKTLSVLPSIIIIVKPRALATYSRDAPESNNRRKRMNERRGRGRGQRVAAAATVAAVIHLRTRISCYNRLGENILISKYLRTMWRIMFDRLEKISPVIINFVYNTYNMNI